jgi:hypothetical protein
MRPGPALATRAALVLATTLGLAGCGDGDGSGWGVVEAPPSPASRTVSLGLGEETTLSGPEGVELRVSLDFTSQPVVPITLSPEEATFVEIHLSVTNAGTAPFSGVLADAADLTVLPYGTLAPVRGESVPSEIALSGVVDFGEAVTIPPGAPKVPGKVIFQIEPDDTPASFSLTIAGGTKTARWAL